MKKTRRRYDQALKDQQQLNLRVANLSLRSPASIASIRPCPLGGEKSWPRIPKELLAVMETGAKIEARIAELERLLGQAHAEIELLKKAFAMTQKKVREERIKPILRDGT